MVVPYEKRYSKVLFPDRPKVFGFVLKRLSIGHLFLLWRCLETGPENALLWTNGELVTALYILSRPWQKAERGLQRRWIKLRFKLWTIQIRFFTRTEEREAVKAFIGAHLDRAWSGPEVWEEQAEKGAKCNAPFLQVLKVRLMHLYGMSQEDALNFSVSEAIWDTACWAEDHGRAEWVSEEDEAMIDKALELAAQEEKTNG
jgi:hypothetical protein